MTKTKFAFTVVIPFLIAYFGLLFVGFRILGWL